MVKHDKPLKQLVTQSLKQTTKASKQKKQKPHNPHDKLFKKFMSDKEVADEFFAVYTPPEIRELCDMNSLQLTSSTFISPELAAHYNDILYEVKTKQGEASYLYFLVEHQSTPDKWIALRIIFYVISTLMRHIVQHPETQKLPLVFPILLYAGGTQHPDNISLNWLDLFEQAEIAKKIYNTLFWTIDVAKLDDERLKQYKKSGTLLYLLRDTRDKQIIDMFENLQPFLAESGLKQELVAVSHNYIYNVAKNNKPKQLKHYLETNTVNLGDKMNYAQYLHHTGMKEGLQIGREEGREEGMQETTQIIARNMLKQGMDIALIHSTTGLSPAEIKKLKA